MRSYKCWKTRLLIPPYRLKLFHLQSDPDLCCVPGVLIGASFKKVPTFSIIFIPAAAAIPQSPAAAAAAAAASATTNRLTAET